jgi:hypothetical protein
MHPEIEVENIDVDFPTFAKRIEEIAKGRGMWANRGTGMNEGVAVGPADSTDESGTRPHIMPHSEKSGAGQVTVVNPHQSEHSRSARKKIARESLGPVIEDYNETYDADVKLTI